MYLFFDTETTGLENPQLVQLAYILSDENGRIIEQNDFIVKPYGFDIPEESVKYHGITTEMANENGISLTLALTKFNTVIQRANHIVAHHVAFDVKVINLAFKNLGKEDVFQGKKTICTANDLKPQSSFPFFWKKKAIRYKLNDLHFKLFNEHFKDAHTASADTMALYKCFWMLKIKNLLLCN